MLTHSIPAQEVSSFQYFFIIKQIFPETKEVAVFISKGLLEKQKDFINRACAQQNLTAKVYIVNDTGDIGRNLKKIGDGSILLLFPDELYHKKSNKLYILSKCKEKKISLITSQPEFSESGALVGIFKDKEKKADLVLNLKHSEHLNDKFTEEFVDQVGFSKVIR